MASIRRFALPAGCGALLALSCCIGNATTSGGLSGSSSGEATSAAGGTASGETSSGSDTSALDNDPTLQNAAFSPLPMAAQVAKAKMMLHGDPVTDADIDVATKQGIGTLIANWQKTSQYQDRMVRFLSVALQQSQVTAENATSRAKGYQFTRGTAGTPQYKWLLQNIKESMARTVLALDALGQPFDTTMTTHQFMMTAPLAAFYVIDDSIKVPDVDNPNENNFTIDADSVINSSTIKGQQSLAFTDQYASNRAAWTTWSMVNIRQRKSGEARTNFVAPSTATPSELALDSPRQGFQTTPAFFNQWRSNTGNSARVQINQALIVALGQQFDGKNYVAPLSTAAMDAAHVQPNTACYGCHIDMDPMRQLYRKYWTFYGDVQKDATQQALPTQFVYGGVSKMTTSSDDLGTMLASHPMMPLAWAQKVCDFANSAPCHTDDPELVRIATDFASHRSFSKLVLAIFSSPLTTYARITETTLKDGVTFPVAKVDQLCPLLSQRLGINDVCGLDPQANPQGAMKTIQTVTSIFPAHSFARGTVNTGQANDPTLFLRSGAENVCALLAGQVVDSATTTGYPSNDPNQAIGNLVHTLMGIPASNDAEPMAILQEHLTAAQAGGLSASDALKSTFVVACLSPSVTGVGQ